MNPDEYFLQEDIQQEQAMHGLYEEWLRDEAAQAKYCDWLASLETNPQGHDHENSRNDGI